MTCVVAAFFWQRRGIACVNFMQDTKKPLLDTIAAAIEIVFPDSGHARSRKVVTRSRARATGKFPSIKANRMLQWESINELNAFRMLEINHEVESFHEQPCVIYYVLDGVEHRHYPDILVKTKSAQEIWEIKPRAEATRPEVIERSKLLELALPDFGYRYRVLIGEDLGRKVRLDNVNDLLDCNREIITPLAREKVRQAFAHASTLTVGSLLDCLHGEVSLKEIYRLIIEGDVSCDMEKRLSSATELQHTSHFFQAKNGAK